jgi:hypothetical protein
MLGNIWNALRQQQGEASLAITIQNHVCKRKHMADYYKQRIVEMLDDFPDDLEDLDRALRHTEGLHTVKDLYCEMLQHHAALAPAKDRAIRERFAKLERDHARRNDAYMRYRRTGKGRDASRRSSRRYYWKNKIVKH